MLRRPAKARPESTQQAWPAHTSTPSPRRLRSIAPVAVAGLAVIGVSVTGGPGIARATVDAPKSIAAPATRSVTLVTGDRVTVRVVKGRTVFTTTSVSGRGVAASHYQSPSGDYYVIPAEASPYFGTASTPRCSTFRRCYAMGSPAARTFPSASRSAPALARRHRRV